MAGSRARDVQRLGDSTLAAAAVAAKDLGLELRGVVLALFCARPGDPKLFAYVARAAMEDTKALEMAEDIGEAINRYLTTFHHPDAIEEVRG